MVDGIGVLSRSRLSKLVDGMIDPDLQIQPNGVDLTLMTVERIVDAGAVDFDNSNRKISSSVKLSFDESGWIELKQGVYKIIFNEWVEIPLDCMAIAFPRSSLLRCGVTIETAVWDSGYSGRSEALLLVMNPAGFRVKRGARLLQMVFLKLTERIDWDSGYRGVYQFENK
ncbi:MAG: deoxyuridine 5'-triphosphate nucleotidohydrolase [Candidatus Syntropharchaeales archaeon]